ncbi:MAG: hypothetical protein AMXMBFR64_42490 [Myxococcales bacterium]
MGGPGGTRRDWTVGLLTLLAMALLPPAVMADEPRDLVVNMDGFPSADGVVYVALFQSADGFPGDQTKALAGQKTRVSPKKLRARVTFRALPPGTYAVSVLHDADGDGALDTNVLGIPTEAVGASNNVRTLGPPSFDDAAFRHPADRILIHVRIP